MHVHFLNLSACANPDKVHEGFLSLTPVSRNTGNTRCFFLDTAHKKKIIIIKNSTLNDMLHAYIDCVCIEITNHRFLLLHQLLMRLYNDEKMLGNWNTWNASKRKGILWIQSRLTNTFIRWCLLQIAKPFFNNARRRT